MYYGHKWGSSKTTDNIKCLPVVLVPGLYSAFYRALILRVNVLPRHLRCSILVDHMRHQILLNYLQVEKSPLRVFGVSSVPPRDDLESSDAGGKHCWLLKSTKSFADQILWDPIKIGHVGPRFARLSTLWTDRWRHSYQGPLTFSYSGNSKITNWTTVVSQKL